MLPCKPAKPELVSDDPDTKKMTVKWEGCPGSPEVTYKLYWDAGVQNGQYELMTETQKKKEFTVDTFDIPSRFFRYYVEAINPCGVLKSPILTTERKVPPLPV